MEINSVGAEPVHISQESHKTKKKEWLGRPSISIPIFKLVSKKNKCNKGIWWSYILMAMTVMGECKMNEKNAPPIYLAVLHMREREREKIIITRWERAHVPFNASLSSQIDFFRFVSRFFFFC